MVGGEVRASDADREKAMRALRRHYAAGRLDDAELEERIGRAARARFRHELRALTRDLPSDVGARGARAIGHLDRIMLRAHVRAYAAVNGALVGIWALACGGGEFWPAWSLVPWGLGLGLHARCS